MAERFPCEKCAGTGEMNDGMSLAEVLDLHGAQLAEIKKHAPKRHAEMMKSYEDFEAARQ